ncbi:hypothetical protein [Terrisporobacter vanillatitrophus]
MKDIMTVPEVAKFLLLATEPLRVSEFPPGVQFLTLCQELATSV